MPRRPATFLIAAALAAAHAAMAAPFVIEKAAGSGKDLVSMASLQVGGEAGVLFRDVLARDLERSGWFENAPARQAAGIEIAGRASGSGGALSTAISVRWGGGSFSWGDNTQGANEARWQAHRLCDEIVRRVKNRQGMAATRIALIGKEGTGGCVCLCDSDGAALQKFQAEKTSPLSPYWTPDCSTIYYTSFSRGYACIFGISAKGGRRFPLANFTGLNTGGAVSPDGRLVAAILSNPGNPELFVINTQTHRATRLTNTPRGAEASPCWSPDGNRIAYVSDENGTPHIYVMDSERKSAARLSYRGAQNVAPSWGPDGRIAYCSKQDGSYKIVVANPATGESSVVSSGSYDWEDPSWAPDGRHIVCSRRDGRTCSLWVLDTEGDPPAKLPLPPGDWRSPEWSGPTR